MRCLGDITDSMDMSLSELREMVMECCLQCCSPWGHKQSDTTERLNNKLKLVQVSMPQLHETLQAPEA